MKCKFSEFCVTNNLRCVFSQVFQNCIHLFRIFASYVKFVVDPPIVDGTNVTVHGLSERWREILLTKCRKDL